MVCRNDGDPIEPSIVYVRLGGIRTSGSEGGDVVRVGVSKVIPHPVNKRVAENFADVALLKLKRPVTYTDTVRPICLPSPDVDLHQFNVCYVIGFGKTAWNGS